MKKRRTTRQAQKPPPAGPAASSPKSLEYKVVELSLVDEQSLERAVNTWVRRGWTLENVQFAMRESSRRPSMAFVFFTREGAPIDALDEGGESAEDSRASEPEPTRRVSAYERLVQLAEGGEEPEDT